MTSQEDNQERNFYLNTSGADADKIQEALRAAGIETLVVRETTPNHDGIIITETLAAGIWDHESGAARCQDPVDQECGHRKWDQLSQEQRDEFTKELASFYEYQRIERMQLSVLLEFSEELGDVKVAGPCNED